MGRYRLGPPIGYGGMAVVYEAWRLFPDDSVFPVALKRILPQLSSDPDFAMLMHREARLCMQLSHPNLVTVHDFDRDEDGQLFLVMERVEGVTVGEATAVEELDYRLLRRIMRDVLRALAYVHDRGVVHRDISPCNILMSTSGEVKLSDFGLARSRDGVRSGFGFKGKAAYASPEAIQCAPLGPSSDLYSLAAVLYELITGKPPFDYGHVMQINRRMSEWQLAPLPDDVPVDLATLTEGLLRYDIGERAYDSAQAMFDALEAHGLPVADDAEMIALVARTRKETGVIHGTGNDASAALPASVEPDAAADGPELHGPGGTLPIAEPPLRRARSRRTIWLAAVVSAMVCGPLGGLIGFSIRGATVPAPPDKPTGADLQPATGARTVPPAEPLRAEKPAGTEQPAGAANGQPTAASGRGRRQPTGPHRARSPGHVSSGEPGEAAASQIAAPPDDARSHRSDIRGGENEYEVHDEHRHKGPDRESQ